MPTLVTGAKGFIGRHLVKALCRNNAHVHVLVRNNTRTKPAVGTAEAVMERHGDLESPQTLEGLCAGMQTVFHLAGYGGSDLSDEAADKHQRMTVEGTRALLAQAHKAGVERFIFASTVKVMGEGGPECLDEASPVAPESAYGRAKRKAEEYVLEAGVKTGMHVCVIRLPLVYGLDNAGNIPRLIGAIDRGVVPPLPKVSNKRSMVHVDDAVQALLLAGVNPAARGQIYIATDGEEYSARRLYDAICVALGRPISRWAMPAVIWNAGAWVGDVVGRLTGRAMPLNSEAVEKLLGSAYYSARKISQELNFRPTRRLEDSLPEMISVYRQRRLSGIV